MGIRLGGKGDKDGKKDVKKSSQNRLDFIKIIPLIKSQKKAIGCKNFN
jgi:hypothetical protein